MTFLARCSALTAAVLLTSLGSALISPLVANAAAPGRLTIHVDKPGVKISPMFYGLMTEEINHSYDGGLYAELIQNRALQDDPKGPVHWAVAQSSDAAGTLALDTANPVPGTALTHSLRLDITTASARRPFGVANDGYWGIPIRPSTTYRASFYAKAAPGFTGPLTLSLESADYGRTQAIAQVAHLGNQWQTYTVTLQTDAQTAETTDDRFVISAQTPGTVWLTQVSLMPPTYHDQPNGRRIDLMQKMDALKPSFLRLPGGNYLEGNTIAERFDWKSTIGPIQNRVGHQGPWGYRSTDGMGLLEMLGWCEDLKMEPLLAVYAGYSLGGEHAAPGPALTPFVQDALDEIEYLTGDASTTWGAKRIADGHPAPFALHYVEIGNEDEYDKSGSYDGRYTQFYDAIKAKYPQLQLIATAKVTGRTPDVVDDHYYRSAADMARDAGHYDKVSRTGPKIFVGEWASIEGSPTPTLQAALGDAAWLTGLERNSDLVLMEAYAPLLVNVNPNARQWGTNLIGYDGLHSFGSPSYYVQSLFAANTGDIVLPVEITPSVTIVKPVPLPHGKVGVGTWATEAEFKDVQVTQGTKTLYQTDFKAGAADWTLGKGQWTSQDGLLRQTSDGTDTRATVGDAGWGDYTYHLQARKISGAEGFLISFHVQDESERIWWNIGGWGNTRTALERYSGGSSREIGSVPVTVETGRWYDIRIEVSGRTIRCYLDGKLITDIIDTPPAPPAPLFAAASRDTKTGEIILKVVNVTADPQTLVVDLLGARKVTKTATVSVLSGEPGDVNSVEEPEKVAPKTVTIAAVSRTFPHEFPAHSVTVLRLKAAR